MIDLGLLERAAALFASARDRDAALREFLALVREVTASSLSALWLRTPDGAQFVRWADTAEAPEIPVPASFIDQLLDTGDQILLADGPHLLTDESASRGVGAHAVAVMGLRHGPLLLGGIALGFMRLPAWAGPTLRIVAALARFPAAAILHARTEELVTRRARLTDILRRFGEQALSTPDLPSLQQLILDTALELTGSDQASITGVADGRVRVVAGIGKDAELVGSEAPVELLAEALSASEPYVVPDVDQADQTKLLVKLSKRSGALSFMALPLRHHDRLVGHLFTGAPARHHYRDEEVEAMRILASMAAAVLEQRRAQAVATAQARRLADTVEHLPLLVEVFDAGGTLAQSNAAARAVRGRLGAHRGTAEAPFEGYRLVGLDGQPPAPGTCPLIEAVAGRTAPSRELVLLAADGGRVATLHIAAAPLVGPDGRVESVVVGCQDVSRLHELAEAKARFLRVAAHELRSPLTALHATTQLAQRSAQTLDDPELRRTVVERIHRQSVRLVRLVEQLLDTVRLDANELPLSPTELDLVALCREVAEFTLPAEGPRAVVRADGPVVGRWDPVRVEQVVTNLLSNAARYSPPDREVEIGVRADGGRALLTVRDHGIGIPAAQLHQLFTPFFRGANANSRNASGLGLGLHIAREIVHRHGGTIAVESRENVGTTFTVELPLT